MSISRPLKLNHFQVFLIWWHSPFNLLRKLLYRPPEAPLGPPGSAGSPWETHPLSPLRPALPGPSSYQLPVSPSPGPGSCSLLQLLLRCSLFPDTLRGSLTRAFFWRFLHLLWLWTVPGSLPSLRCSSPTVLINLPLAALEVIPALRALAPLSHPLVDALSLLEPFTSLYSPRWPTTLKHKFFGSLS